MLWASFCAAPKLVQRFILIGYSHRNRLLYHRPQLVGVSGRLVDHLDRRFAVNAP
jgi:hypothetical protein